MSKQYDPFQDEDLDVDMDLCAAFSILGCKGSVMPKVFPHILAVFAIAIIFSFAYGPGGFLHDVETLYTFDPTAHQILGVALALLLVFELAISYHRYYEGAKETSNFMKHVRTTALLCSFVQEKDTIQAGAEMEKQGMEKFRFDAARLLNTCFDTFRQAVTGKGFDASNSVYTKEEKSTYKVDTACMLAIKAMLELLKTQKSHGRIDPAFATEISSELSGMSQAYHNALCSRKTPFPFHMKQLRYLLTIIWCYTVPIMLASLNHQLLLWAPIASVCMVLFFFGAQQISHELENPFGSHHFDLNLTKYGAAISEDIALLLGDDNTPRWLA